MTLRPGETRGHGIAIFPFLKTSAPFKLGSLTLRSTDDLTDLNEDDSNHVREIAEMLFLQDDLRLRSSTYALLTPLDVTEHTSPLRELEYVQAIVAYCYSAPHPTFGDPFLSFEQASLAVFSPEPVPVDLVRPDQLHVMAIDPGTVGSPNLRTPGQSRRVEGYEGLYNFQHVFWVARGSRLYPPVPHLGLNVFQDLTRDLTRFFVDAPQHQFLPDLLRSPETPTAKRVFTAFSWYNRANSLTRDDEGAILDLAVAFETLLALPRDAKTDRLVDAISLLLGRLPRLALWSAQFYNARSEIAHEGRTERMHFVPTMQTKSASGLKYRPLLSYGRQIFQLCVGTLLFGAQLATRSRLPDKLVTNQERFEFICKTLDDDALAIVDRFAAIDEAVASASEFRFVAETGLRLETLLGAVRRAAEQLLLCQQPLDPVFRQRVADVATAPHASDAYELLHALSLLCDTKIADPTPEHSPQAVVRLLAEIVWMYTFTHYSWLRERRSEQSSTGVT